MSSIILFFKKLKNYFKYGIFKHPIKDELKSIDDLISDIDNLSQEEKNKYIEQEDKKDKNKIFWFIPLMLFIVVFRMNRSESVFEVINQNWADVAIISIGLILIVFIWRKQTE